MSNPVRPSTKCVSNSDSFFGMALAQAFTGFAFGPGFEQLWDAGEMASAVYEDRMVSKRANGRVYEVGVKNSLADDFSRTARDWTMMPGVQMFKNPAPVPSYTF